MKVYVTIGNSDGKLGHKEWDEFIRTTRTLLKGYGIPVGEWRRDEWPFVNAIFCYDLLDGLVVDGDARYGNPDAVPDKGLRHHLAGIAANYRQDSIAFAMCEPELIRP